MKRKILLLSLLAICFSIAAVGSYAFFTTEGTAKNVITTGNVRIEVVEKMFDGTELVDFPKEGVSGVLPGTSVSKIVEVKNVGQAEAWVRLRVDVSAESEAGEPLDASLISFAPSERWLDGGDGFFYYKTSVPAGGATEALFREVTFSPKMDKSYGTSTIRVRVEAHAVQTANNPIPDGGDVTGVQGWPEA